MPASNGTGQTPHASRRGRPPRGISEPETASTNVRIRPSTYQMLLGKLHVRETMDQLIRRLAEAT